MTLCRKSKSKSRAMIPYPDAKRRLQWLMDNGIDLDRLPQDLPGWRVMSMSLSEAQELAKCQPKK